MEKELFQAILRDPALLSEVDEVILDQWIRDYPFAGWPHVMKALKRKQEGRLTDLDVHRAAMYVSDRAGLYEWLEWEVPFVVPFESDVETRFIASPEVEKGEGIEEERGRGGEETRALGDHGDGEVEEEDGMTVRRQDGMTDEGLEEEDTNVETQDFASPESESETDDARETETEAVDGMTIDGHEGIDRYESLPDTDDPFIGWLRAHRLGAGAVEDHGDSEVEKEDGMTVRRQDGMTDEGLDENVGAQNIAPETDDDVDVDDGDGDVGAQNIAPDTDDDVETRFIASPEVEEDDEKTKKRKHKKKGKKGKNGKKEKQPPLKKLIAKSIIQDQEIASEPLADLLARQGHIQQAISMYERLTLIFPEKSAFFALKIKKLKKK